MVQGMAGRRMALLVVAGVAVLAVILLIMTQTSAGAALVGAAM